MPPDRSALAAAVQRSVTLAIPLAQAYAEASMTSTVTIRRPAGLTLNDATGVLEPNPESTVYSGKARVYAVSGPQVLQLGEEPQYYSTTYVTIPQGAAVPKVDDLVHIDDTADANLKGRDFRVIDVAGGGMVPASTRLEVTGIQASPEWGS